MWLKCGALRDVVPFVQFKKREKHLWRSVNFSVSLKLTLLHGCFLNCTNGAISHNAPQITSLWSVSDFKVCLMWRTCKRRYNYYLYFLLIKTWLGSSSVVWHWMQGWKKLLPIVRKGSILGLNFKIILFILVKLLLEAW